MTSLKSERLICRCKNIRKVALKHINFCNSVSSSVFKFIFYCFIALCLTNCVAIKDFKHTKAGTSVNLSKKGLKAIPEEVFENKNIKVLRLFGNEIDSISERIGELENLEKLYLGKNNLTTLPKSIGNLKNLKILSVQYNDITSLPNEIGEMTNLKQITLNQNSLKTLPSTIGDLKKLEILELKFNQLTSLPEEITDCENLKFIYLNRNNLTALPDSLNKLTHLKELYMVGSGALIDIPESLCDIRNLEVLEIDAAVAVPPCVLVLKANRLQIIQK